MAEAYGFGAAEELLGQSVRATKSDVIVATKFFPHPWRWRKVSLVHALRASLNRLGLVPIPGAKTARQAQENVGALGWQLSEGEMAALDAASESAQR
jgi:aryl-alcohol dehydrogenase-like predicted oxidoreductase